MATAFGFLLIMTVLLCAKYVRDVIRIGFELDIFIIFFMVIVVLSFALWATYPREDGNELHLCTPQTSATK